jgi:hypothetical protein
MLALPRRSRRDDADKAREVLSPRVLTVGRAGTAVKHWLLWAMLAGGLALLLLLAVRGASGSHASQAASAASVPAFPDEEAQAFAASFATVYLSYAPDKTDEYEAQVAPYLDSAVSASDAVDLQAGAQPQRVLATWPARTKDLGHGLGRVTVACKVVSRSVVRMVYLAVPVARDARRGLVVADYPAPVSPPRRGAFEATGELPLDDAASKPIMALLQRFLAAYLSGQPVAPEFLAPGADVAPLGHDYAFRELVSVAQAGPPTNRGRIILATVRADDSTTKAQFTLRYRVLVARPNDRWLVKQIQS